MHRLGLLFVAPLLILFSNQAQSQTELKDLGQSVGEIYFQATQLLSPQNPLYPKNQYVPTGPLMMNENDCGIKIHEGLDENTRWEPAPGTISLPELPETTIKVSGESCPILFTFSLHSTEKEPGLNRMVIEFDYQLLDDSKFKDSPVKSFKFKGELFLFAIGDSTQLSITIEGLMDGSGTTRDDRPFSLRYEMSGKVDVEFPSDDSGGVFGSLPKIRFDFKESRDLLQAHSSDTLNLTAQYKFNGWLPTFSNKINGRSVSMKEYYEVAGGMEIPGMTLFENNQETPYTYCHLDVISPEGETLESLGACQNQSTPIAVAGLKEVKFTFASDFITMLIIGENSQSQEFFAVPGELSSFETDLGEYHVIGSCDPIARCHPQNLENK